MFLPVPRMIVDAEDEGEDSRPSKRRKSDHDPDFASRLAEENKSNMASRTRIPESLCMLKSLKDLRKAVEAKCHEGEFDECLFSISTY